MTDISRHIVEALGLTAVRPDRLDWPDGEPAVLSFDSGGWVVWVRGGSDRASDLSGKSGGIGAALQGLLEVEVDGLGYSSWAPNDGVGGLERLPIGGFCRCRGDIVIAQAWLEGEHAGLWTAGGKVGRANPPETAIAEAGLALLSFGQR